MSMAALSAALFLILICQAFSVSPRRSGMLVAAAMSLHVVPWLFRHDAAAGAIAAVGSDQVLMTVASLHWLGWLSAGCIAFALLRGRGWLACGFLGMTCASAGAVLLLETNIVWRKACRFDGSGASYADSWLWEGLCTNLSSGAFFVMTIVVASLYGVVSISLAAPRRTAEFVTFSSYFIVTVYSLSDLIGFYSD